MTKGTSTLTQHEDTGLTSEQLYDILRFRPEHAEGIVRSFLEVYGNTYPTPFVYDAERIIELNKSKELISVVAVVKDTDKVVGHASAQPYYPDGSAELSLAVVNPAHQGHSLLTRMSAILFKESLSEGVHRTITHEVTSHVISQVISRKIGHKNCGVALGAMPSSLEFKGATGVVAQRETCVVGMKFLAPPAPVTICAPTHHQEIISQIYAYIGKQISFATLPTPTGASSVTSRVNNEWGIADIAVQRIGNDTQTKIQQHLHDLINEQGAFVVFLELPMDQGGIDQVCRKAESEGFFFAGLGPNTVDGGESLFLQYLNTELDTSLVKIASPMGQKILEYVAFERKRVITAQR